MASISATGFLPQSLTLSSATARASTRRPIACLSAQLQQQQPPSQRIERRKIMVIGAVGLVAPALWDSSNGEIEMAMAASSGFTDMPALRGKDYGKTKMRYPDYTETVSGLQYKDLRVGNGPTPKMGDTVVVDWDGYTIGYYGRIFEARNKTKGGSFVVHNASRPNSACHFKLVDYFMILSGFKTCREMTKTSSNLDLNPKK
ncbi:peptidyl-prolyl cis-trans isomerase FKBP19, chloroplastic isoform X3 [Gossypium hirsutum]|uniref:Peptidyl-prolyl cis-trans isomerase FKBP19, chloroplastic isoform X3 n=1 Tax=Gossypium hirsutum TaxID=3635 RepID=A0ABM3BK39_GOSHI|nr:peptidyl-prolyl cis-trans isomerase FKBP19, chloroplastic-like isoform X3 [Gossypium hirsutum]